MKAWLSCDLCGAPVSSTAGRAFARCHPCRRIAPLRRVIELALCLQCGSEFRPRLRAGGELTKTCSKLCAQHLRVGRVPGDATPGHNAARYALERLSPGLSRGDRTRLLHRWIAQSRVCAFCSGLATTVDHVIPLFRGGSNFEGNLVPACRPCNISKGRWLLVEWRAHRATQLRCVSEPLRGEAA